MVGYCSACRTQQEAVEAAEEATALSLGPFLCHKSGCTWATELPTGFPHTWGCSCGLDKVQEPFERGALARYVAAQVAAAEEAGHMDGHACEHLAADKCTFQKGQLERYVAAQMAELQTTQASLQQETLTLEAALTKAESELVLAETQFGLEQRYRMKLEVQLADLRTQVADAPQKLRLLADWIDLRELLAKACYEVMANNAGLILPWNEAAHKVECYQITDAILLALERQLAQARLEEARLWSKQPFRYLSDLHEKWANERIAELEKGKAKA
jgi:hypothetical protein